VVTASGRSGALIGGLAVSVRAEPRFTRDADIAVAVGDDDEAEAILGAFLDRGYALTALLEQSGVGRLSGARLLDAEGIAVDVLTASSGIETDIVDAADLIDVATGVRLPVAAIGHLIALKLLSVAPGRETDAADLRSLARAADEDEWQRATTAVDRITATGYHRGRDLMSDLATLRATQQRTDD
jgi:predicted nucleotidyltransferase